MDSPMRSTSLVALCLNSTALTVAMHISRAYADPYAPRYKASSAVLLTEMGKLLCSVSLAFFEVRAADRVSPYTTGSPQVAMNEKKGGEGDKGHVEPPARKVGWRNGFNRVIEETFAPNWWRLCVPAGLFTLQANLQYLAIANLSVPVFQCFSQLKILTTALCAVVLLKRPLNHLQWLSLAVLAIGVAMVQVDATGTSTNSGHREMNQTMGMAAILVSCMSSGFASIYFELQLKQAPDANVRPTGLWVRNIQLSMFAIVCAFGGVVVDMRNYVAAADGSLIRGSFLAGFTNLVWLVVGLQIMGGLLAALVIKHADNLQKTFSVSFSIVLSFAASVYLFDFQMGFVAMLGAALLLLATWLYTIAPKTGIGNRRWHYSSAWTLLMPPRARE